MNYIVFDLEWNQSPNGKKTENAALPFEILEIGAVRLDERMHVLDTFHTCIRPQIYKILNSHIQKILNKSIEEYADGSTFPEAAEAFMNWCGQDYFFCTWGSADLTELQRNMRFY